MPQRQWAACEGHGSPHAATPAQLGSDTQKLVQSGQRSLKQAALLRISSEPLALVGPQGQIVPFTASQKATLDNTPINALQIVKTQISALQRTGEANNPESNYKDWTGILSALQSLQGTRRVLILSPDAKRMVFLLSCFYVTFQIRILDFNSFFRPTVLKSVPRYLGTP